MKKTNKALARGGWRVQSAVVAIVAILLGFIDQSGAQITNISSQNSSIQVDLADGTSGGLSDWLVDGVNQLNQQWFYYSIGSGPVYSIDNLATWSNPSISHGSSPTLTETYAGSDLSVKTSYQLQGQTPGSGRSALNTTITIANTLSTSEVVTFYQYSDFYLGGVSGNQNVQFNSGANFPVIQSGLNGGPLNGQVTAQTIQNGNAVFITPEEEAAIYDGTQFGLGEGVAAPTLNGVLTAGPGNVDFAYEWNVTLAATGTTGSSLQISEIQTVPEPSSLAMMVLGILGLAFFSRRGFVFYKNVTTKA